MAKLTQATTAALGAEGNESATALQTPAAPAATEPTAAPQDSGAAVSGEPVSAPQGFGAGEPAEVTEQSEQVKQFPVKLRIFMDSFTDKETQEHKAFIAAELVDPFPAYIEDFNHIRVAPRWDNDAAIFRFRMGLYLKTADDITINGVCKEVTYTSKREKGKQITYPALFFKLPYRENLIEFGFKKQKNTDNTGKTVYVDSGNSYVFRDLVAELWGGNYDAGAESSTLGDEDNAIG